jgi:hypothetical protein
MRRQGDMYRRLLALVRRRRLERDLDDEIAFHLAMREAEHQRSGLTPREAEISARRQFGNPALLKEQTRDTWLFSSFDSWLQDWRRVSPNLLVSCQEAQIDAIQSISTSEFPGMPPAAAIVVLTGGSAPKRPRYASFIPA